MNYNDLLKLVKNGYAKKIEGRGYKDFYVTRSGNVYSCSKKGEGSPVKKLVPQKNNKGYLRVRINSKNLFVHRLVALSFVSNDNNFETIDHIDGDKLNNNYTNLNWCSNLTNMRNARKNGLFKTSTLRKLSNEEVREIRNMYKTQKITHKEIAKIFNVSRQTIGSIVKNELYKGV